MHHQTQTVYKDRPVIVKIGYDVRCAGFFMLVEPVEEDNPDAGEETGLIYSNLDDAAIPFPGMTASLDHYKAQLRKMGIPLPLDFFQRVLAKCD